MTLSKGDLDFVGKTDAWLENEGPRLNIIASSRVRLARNLPDIGFPMRAHQEDLRKAAAVIAMGLERCDETRDFRRININDAHVNARSYLRENQYISAEFEKGGDCRFVSISSNFGRGMMVNEEDHIRLYSMKTGFQLQEVLEEALATDSALCQEITPAYSEEFGFLTACPTNVGTGMRASVMVHLPALVTTQNIQEITDIMPEYGLTVRGFYGENSEFLGDFFQISNEQTLGKTEEKIVADLTYVVDQIATKELEARSRLIEEKPHSSRDMIARAVALLKNAHIMNSSESVKLLSKLRLGIDFGLIQNLSHGALNRLFIQVQPGHLQFPAESELEAEERDAKRAQLLRSELSSTTFEG
jgi:protein arginine kinase